jgi:transcriptional regulator with XRE-family HTH domain
MPAEALAITFEPMSSAGRGSRVRARRVKMGISVKELAMRAGVDRGTLSSLEADDDRVRDTTIAAIERALDLLEQEMGMDAPGPDEEKAPGLVRFEVTGVYGADALVVEGPVENLAELEAMIDRIMRGSRAGERGNGKKSQDPPNSP